jgi:hypothetical protein
MGKGVRKVATWDGVLSVEGWAPLLSHSHSFGAECSCASQAGGFVSA